MATEQLLVRAVEAGGDRQQAHEVIRVHSIAAARAMKHEGRENDMLARLAADEAFGVPMDDIRDALDASRFIGRSAEQVDEFLAEAVMPALAPYEAQGGAADDVRV
jgi:adenylosuccinate lyase